MNEAPSFTRQPRFAAALLWAPILVLASGLCAVESWRAVRPGARWFAAPFSFTMADAIERDEVLRAYEFIHAGQDPGTLIPVSHPAFTADRTLFVPPLLWAVATQAPLSVRMLVGAGAGRDPEASRLALCLARQLGYVDIEATLRQYDTQSSPISCPVPGPGEALLPAFVPRTD